MPRRTLPALVLLLGGCAPSAGSLRGVYLRDIPFEPQKPGHCGPAALSSLLRHWGLASTQEEIGKQIYRRELQGTLGFELWLYAKRAGLVALEAKGPDLDALLTQGIPCLLNLDLGMGPASVQHYVLAVGHDRSGWWILQDGRRPDRVVSDAWLLKRWEKTGRFALIAFPPENPVSGMGSPLHLQAADLLGDLGKPRAALRHLEEALGQGADEATVRYRMGVHLKSLGDLLSAEKSYRAAMKLAPGNPDAFNNLALLLLEDISRMNEAEALARSAVTLSRQGPWTGRLPYALDTLGLVLKRQKRTAEARQAFEAALAVAEPESALAREIQGHLGFP